MDKTKKEELVGELQEKFTSAAGTFLVDYKGIKMDSMTNLRNALRAASVDFKVVRNTLAKRAIEGTPAEGIKEHFVGPVAVAFANGDAAQAAKVLTDFAKDEPLLELKHATLGAEVLSLEEIKALSALPSREVLLGKLLGSLSGVPGGLVGVLAAVPRQLLYTLKAIEETKQ